MAEFFMQFILQEEYLFIKNLVNGTHVNTHISIVSVQAPEITETFPGLPKSFFADLKFHIELIWKVLLKIYFYYIYR